MKVLVNGQEREDIARQKLPLDILKAVEDEAARSGAILSELNIDGVSASREDFCTLQWGDTVSFTLVPFSDFLQESLSDAVDYSQRLILGVETIAERLEHGELTAALGLAEIIDGVNWLIGIYERGRIFTPVPLRLTEDAELTTELLQTLEHLLGLAMSLDVGKQAQEMATCLRAELLPRVQMLEHRVTDLSIAAQMPLQ